MVTRGPQATYEAKDTWKWEDLTVMDVGLDRVSQSQNNWSPEARRNHHVLLLKTLRRQSKGTNFQLEDE